MEVLVDAKKEYLNQLAIIMVPFMIETFQDVYNESVSRSKNKKVIAMTTSSSSTPTRLSIPAPGSMSLLLRFL